MQSAKLNIFQRLVRQWDTLHPYNAAQVLRIAGPADLAQLQEHWRGAIDAMGLGKLKIKGSRFHYEHLNGQSDDHGVVRVSPARELEEFISDELNRPFDEQDDFPFRPFVVEDGDSHYLGVVYQHWVADSVSIRWLLREWFVRQYDPSAARMTPIDMPVGGYWKFFGSHRAKWQLGEGILSSVRWSSRFKRVKRIEHPTFSDFRVRFSMHRTPAGWLDRLYASTRGRGYTLNDLFLAAIADACQRFVPVQRTVKRQDLALGTIVDLRPHAPDDLSNTFGLFLGFTSVTCRPDDLKDWDRLVRTIARQNALHKKTGVPQASPVRMLAGLFAGRILKSEDAITFYRKRVPLAGGISNVNLNHSWAAQYHPTLIQEYIRVSPTGPMMPLVFTTTTLGKEFHFGLTRRAALIDDARANAMANHFIERLSAQM